jgi:AcrR family transcriptional regulator
MPPRIPNLEELLLVKAAELIATRGPDALSLRELGRRAGVSRAAPYHYFTDKAELVARVGALGFRRLGERIAAHVDPAADAFAQLRAGLLAYIDFARDEGHFFQLMFSGALQRELSEESRFAFSSGAARETFGVLLHAVEDAQARGVMKQEDPLLVVNVFWAYTHGVAVLARGNHLKHEGGSTAVFDAGFAALVREYRN